MSESVQVVGAAEMMDAIAAAIARAKSADPMAAVTVLMPSGTASGSALNELARNGGIFNVHFLTLEHFAYALVEGQVSARRLGGAMKRELVRQVATNAKGPLGRFESSALAKGLVGVFGDMSHRAPGEIETIASSGSLASELVRLYGLYRERLDGKYLERSDALRLAAIQVGRVADTSPVIAVVLEPPSAFEADLLNAIAETGRLQVVGVMTGMPELDVAVEPWLWGLGGQQRHVALSDSTVDKVVVAPDADTEVQLALTELLAQAANGVPFSRMALLYSNKAPYARIVEDQMRLAGVNVRGSVEITLGQTLAGGFVLRLLDVVTNDFDRDAVGAWLLSSNKEQAPDWMRIARRAHVSGSASTWVQRLRSFAEEQVQRVRNSDDAIVAETFAVFVESVDAWLQIKPTSWQGWAEWLQSGIEQFLGSHGARADWPFHEAQAAVSVEGRLAKLVQLDSLGGKVRREVFVDAVQEDLNGHRIRSGGRSGLFVGTIGEAVGCNFDAVVICGMVEGLMPGAVQSDGLRASLRVPGEEVRSERDTRLFELRMASGGHHTLTMPAADIRAQRPLRPSRLLLEQAARKASALVDTPTLMSNSERWPWLEVFTSFTEVVAQPRLQMGRQLDELSFLYEDVVKGNDCTDSSIFADVETYKAGVQMLRSRDSGDFTRYDGFVGQPVPLGGEDSPPLRVTALEKWAKCPFQYLLDSVLQVEYDDDDAALLAMNPRDRGQLIHTVFELFVDQMPNRVSPEQEWTSDERLRLHEIVDEQFGLAVKRGTAPDGFTTDTQRKGLHRQLEELLDQDQQMRAAYGVVPVAVEKSFGTSKTPAVSVTTANGEPVWFRGRVDRIDASADATRVVVTDYKTGKYANAPLVKGDALAAGRSLQLSIYAKSAQRDYPNARVRSDYWFVGDEASNYRRAGIELDEDTNARSREVFGYIGNSFQNGAFPAVPGDEDGRTSFQNCRNCPYDLVCPRDRSEAWLRKSSDELVTPYVALTGPKEVGE